MPHLQVKNIDPRLYHSLQKRAKKEHRPLSQQVIHIISNYLRSHSSSKSIFPAQKLLSWAGQWKENRSAEEIIRDIKKSRKSKKAPAFE